MQLVLAADIEWARGGREVVWQMLSAERARFLLEAAAPLIAAPRLTGAAEARITRLEDALRRHTQFFTDSHDTQLCGGCLEPSPCPDAGLLP